MNIRIARLIFFVCAITALIIPVSTNAQSGKGKHHHYKLIDIGTFGGPQSYIVETGIPRAGTDINNSGVFTGFADTSTPDPFPAACFNPDCFVSHAFQRRNGGMNDLGALLSGLSSAPAGISASGLIAGLDRKSVV